jgi:hypothetical protein
VVTTVTGVLAPAAGAVGPLITSVTGALAAVTGTTTPVTTSTTTPAVTTAAQTLTPLATGTGGKSAVGLWGIALSLLAGSASAAGAAALGAGLSWRPAGAGGGAPVSSAPVLPRLPVMPGGGPDGATGAGGPGGGNSGGGAQVRASAALRTQILLRLMHYAAAKPIWLSYLPEVPPA